MATLTLRSTVAMAVAVFLLATPTSAQPSCAASLVGCQPFLGTTTKPTQSCCAPLQQAIQTQLPCLCSLYNSPGLLQAFNISLAEALALPGRCGISGNTNSCLASAPSPQATPGGNNSNAAHGLAWIGTPGLMSLLVLLWSIMA